MKSKTHPIDVAASILGGREKMAKILGVTIAAIGNWKMRGTPLESCTAIEKLTNGQVTRRDLCPTRWQKVWPDLEPESETPFASGSVVGK